MITNGWRINTHTVWSRFCQFDLGTPIKTMPDLSPIYQVFTVVNRNPRKVFEGARHQIVIVSYSTHAGIRVKA
ncbi:hypothetical protein D3C71_1632820 [compost metagenome]